MTRVMIRAVDRTFIATRFRSCCLHLASVSLSSFHHLQIRVRRLLVIRVVRLARAYKCTCIRRSVLSFPPLRVCVCVNNINISVALALALSSSARVSSRSISLALPLSLSQSLPPFLSLSLTLPRLSARVVKKRTLAPSLPPSIHSFSSER